MGRLDAAVGKSPGNAAVATLFRRGRAIPETQATALAHRMTGKHAAVPGRLFFYGVSAWP